MPPKRPGIAALLDPRSIAAPAGPSWCRSWTGSVDEALQRCLDGLVDRSRRRGGVALVALGSYSRRALCPSSDIDLLLLHDGWPREDLERLVRAVCYPLWDAGLTVGHAVRTPADAVRAAAHRVDSATALTERRLVAGAPGLLDDLAARVNRWLRRHGGRMLADLAAADATRHARYGATPGALEPELKDGVGGLRDIGSLRWAAAAVLGQAGLDPLVGARYLAATDRRELAAAEATLLTARCALHLAVTGSPTNVLRLQDQDDVAARIGLSDGDALLRAVGLATRTVAHLHARTWPLLRADAERGRRRRRPAPTTLDDGIVLADGLVQLTADASLGADPSLGMRAVAAAGLRSTVLGREAAHRLRHEVAQAAGGLPWTVRGRQALLSALRAGPRALGAFGDADHLGLLTAHLPEWDRVRGRRQRNPLHVYDLDTHGLQAVATLVEIAEGLLGDGPTAVWQDLTDTDTLLLGTWLHDVGKAWPGDHSKAGEAVTREWVADMGFGDGVGERVGRLVRHHLLLPDAATQRDLDDPAEILDVAVTVGDVWTLDALYLLSLADARATGPAAWSAWKELLIERLYRRARGVLTEGVVPGLARTPEAVLRAAAARANVDRSVLARLLDGVGDRYLLAGGPEQLAAHAELLATPLGPGELRAAQRPGPVGGTAVLSVVAPDHRGLVANCAGVLAAHRLEVLDARAFTHGDGTALDWFTVAVPGKVEWHAVIADLRAAESGDLDVAGLVARRETARDARPPTLAEPVAVQVRVFPGDRVCRVEVHGPDSPGGLYRLTRALADAGVDLLGAQVTTVGPEMRDAFVLPAGAVQRVRDLEERLAAAVRRPTSES